MLNFAEIDSPLMWSDKETIAVTIENVTLEGFAAIPYTNCEIYAPVGLNTDVNLPLPLPCQYDLPTRCIL